MTRGSMPDTSQPDLARVLSEEARVRAHVELRFLTLGFDELEARALASSGADWHEAKRLLDAGCPLAVALEILL